GDAGTESFALRSCAGSTEPGQLHSPGSFGEDAVLLERLADEIVGVRVPHLDQLTADLALVLDVPEAGVRWIATGMQHHGAGAVGVGPIAMVAVILGDTQEMTGPNS